MRYGILGPLEVTGDDGPVLVAGAKQRALLVLLLVNADRVVSVDRLIDQLWAGQPPARATVTLRSYVSMLRRVLDPGRRPRSGASVLAWRPPGYLLRVTPDELDAVRFERLARAGCIAGPAATRSSSASCCAWAPRTARRRPRPPAKCRRRSGSSC
jgi:DNA-binding SARP family transcriptional activator